MSVCLESKLRHHQCHNSFSYLRHILHDFIIIYILLI